MFLKSCSAPYPYLVIWLETMRIFADPTQLISSALHGIFLWSLFFFVHLS